MIFGTRLCAIRRGFSTAAVRQKAEYAFAFDIDGVLIKGNRAIPEAKRALAMLNGDNPERRRIPYVLLTNGGGVTESEKASQISKMLGVEIPAKQMILSHSPMQALVPQYRDKVVLIVGGKDRACHEVAAKYGFKNILTPDDIHLWQASVWPFRDPKRNTPSDNVEESMQLCQQPIGAVLVFHDSRDWGRDLQIVLDAVSSKDGILATQQDESNYKQSVPLYFSNNDIIWSTDFPVPRLGQGSFKLAVESIYKKLTGQDLQSTSFGKPHKATYEYAETVLANIQGHKPKRVYAVGDNPAADIKGANDYGWSSILVRTGIFRGPGNSSEFPATTVCDNVEEAVEWVLEKEGNK